MEQIVLASNVSVNGKVMRKMMRKVMMNPPSPFSCNGRLMGAGTMPHSLTRAEDWARAETFAKRTSFHSRIWAEPEQPLGSANYLDGEWASWKAARDGKMRLPGLDATV
jgi:hypothetical protein